MHDLHRPRPGRGLHSAHVRHDRRTLRPDLSTTRTARTPACRPGPRSRRVAENPLPARPSRGCLVRNFCRFRMRIRRSRSHRHVKDQSVIKVRRVAAVNHTDRGSLREPARRPTIACLVGLGRSPVSHQTPVGTVDRTAPVICRRPHVVDARRVDVSVWREGARFRGRRCWRPRCVPSGVATTNRGLAPTDTVEVTWPVWASRVVTSFALSLPTYRYRPSAE